MTTFKALTTALACVWLMGLSGCGGESGAQFITSGKDLLAKKDLRGAVIQFKNALQKDPKSAEARYLLGKALLEGGDPVAALVELRKAQELQAPDEQVLPPMAQAMLLVGEESKVIAQYADVQLKDPAAGADLKTSLATAYGVQKDIDKALVNAQSALSLQPGYPPALIVLARLKLLSKDVDGAMALLEDILKAEPTHEKAGVLKGELLLYSKADIEGSVAAYRKVIDGHPSSVVARSAVANILFRQGKMEQVKAELAQLKKSAPNHPETLFLEARVAFADKDYKRTRELSDVILKFMPDNVRVLELAGTAEYMMKGYVQAEALLSRALKLTPMALNTRQLLAQTYLRSGQPSKTIDILQPAVDGDKPDPGSLALVGEAHLQLGDLKRSEDAFQAALKLAPQDSRLRTAAAVTQIARGNAAGALTELESVAKVDSGPRADLALIAARLRQNDVPGALKAVDVLEKKMPDDALPYHLRGRVLLLKNDLPAAQRSFENALTKDAAYFPSVASLAAIELAAGKPDDARKRFEALLQTQPKNWQAKMALAELQARTGAPQATVLASMREAIKVNASEPRPHLLLIDALILSGDSKAALQAAQEANAALPENRQIQEFLGRAELAAGDHQRAISTFKKLAASQPRNALYQMRLADAYIAAKDPESAERALRQAAAVQPTLAGPQRGLALLALQANRPQDALTIARDLQKRNPKDATGFVLEGDVEMQRKGWDAAVSAFRAALQRAPATETVIKQHNALLAGGKVAEASRVAGEWIKGNPKDAAFVYHMGDLALADGDMVAAEARYRAVLDIQPENALALNNIAWLLAKQGKSGSVALAERANKLMPERAPLLDTLAFALEAENQLPKAIEAQKRAVALTPQDPNMSLRLAKLYIKNGDKDRARAELDTLAKLGEKYANQPEVASLLKSL
jgi:putative PEP-CTERM system TPR-repeat lipoprotein